ncbi:hypothetical protein IT396_02065 [Candidatus Nomurabacteria bacterium]|nr:hypothetical protein [Candidatus Nomurabacteria bacterium]
MTLHNLQNEAYKNRMTPEEKSAMKAQIFGMPSVAPQASPYFHFSFQFFSTRVLAPLAVVFLISSGTTYAAEGALPGDTLYPVKVYVNESVVLSLARTPEAKAEAHASLAERRVEEAQALAAEGRLDASTTEALAVEVEAHVEEAEVRAAEAEEVESGKSRQVRAKLAATLDTGARVLARIGADKDEGTRESAETLSVRLLARADRESAVGATVFSKMAAPATDMATQTMSLMVASESDASHEDPAAQKDAAMLEHEAARALTEAREVFEDNKKTLDAEMTSEIEKQFSSVETSMSLGSASLGAGAYMQASEDFSAALRLAVKLQKLLEAHQKFDTDIIESLLHDEEDDHSEDEGQVHGTSTEEGSAGTSGEVEIRGGILPKVLD